MTHPTDNESWVIEEGDRVIRKKASLGMEKLTTWERLVYSLWVADYGMRNAGDLMAARMLYADFQSLALRAAEELKLPLTRSAFSMPLDALEEVYFEWFEAICAEIKHAGSDPPV